MGIRNNVPIPLKFVLGKVTVMFKYIMLHTSCKEMSDWFECHGVYTFVTCNSLKLCDCKVHVFLFDTISTTSHSFTIWEMIIDVSRGNVMKIGLQTVQIHQ